MIHFMKLNPLPFQSIKKGEKYIEMRLFDTKRSLFKVGDQIRFSNALTNETIDCTIKALYRYTDFFALYSAHDKISLGYKKDETADPNDMNAYYSESDIKKYGVVAIEIELS